MRVLFKHESLVLIFAGLIHAGTSMTLSEALKAALNGNASLQEQQWEVVQSEADRVTAGLRPNPQLQLTGDVFDFNGGPLVQPEKKDYGVSLQLPVEFPGKRGGRVAVAQGNLRAEKSGYQETVQQTLLAVGNAWLDALQARLSLSSTLKAKGILDSIVSINEIRLRDRIIAPLELMRSRILADQYETSRQEAELQVARTSQTLGLLLGNSEAVDAEEQDTSSFHPPSEDSCVTLALARRGAWLQAGDALTAARANEDLQRHLGLPDFNFSLDYSKQQGVPFYGVSVGIPLPLLARNQGEAAKAHAAAQEASINRDFLRLQLESEVRTLHREFSERRAGLEALKNVLDSAEKVRSMVEYSYRKGTSPIFDLLDAQRTWFDTQQSYYDAWVDFRRTGLQLAAACGLLDGGTLAVRPDGKEG